MRKTIVLILLSTLLFMLVACSENSRDDIGNLTVGSAIMVTIRAEVIEIISNRALAVEVIEPPAIYDNGENVLLPGVLATVIYGEDIDWIGDVIDNEIGLGSTIEFSRGITLGQPDFLQEPFEVRGINIRIFDEDGSILFEQGF